MKHYFKQLFSRNSRSAVREPATNSAKNSRLKVVLISFSLWLTVADVFAATCTNGFPQAVFPLQCGMAVATCAALANGGVNTNGYVVAVSDIRNPAVNSPGLGLNWCAPMLHNELAYQPLGFQSPTNIWNAANLGQVFGVMLDDATNPNIYVAATRIYGVAQFGFGGPGAVYKLNGTTGVPTLFAQLTNSGPALGNLCYDPVNKQVFVSNFEDGLIYRYTAAGTFVDTFDHGVNGRPNEALAVIADSGILGQATVLGRRVFGVQVHNSRVYYSVWAEDVGLSSATTTNEIWSVALNSTGGFNVATAQLEIQVPQYAPSYSNPVADINFSASGKMLLAERTTYSSSSTLFFAGAHSSRILEYQFSGTQWLPSGNNFYIGEWLLKNNCTGGADYNCAGEVVGTGDGVKLDSEVAYGIAILPAGGNTPATVATGSYIIDLNGQFGTQDKTQIGEIAVVKNCCECLAISSEVLTCGTNGTYTYTFNITNQFTGPIGYVSFLEVPTNITVTPNSPIPLQPPLLPGQGTTLTVTIANASGLTNFCFLLSAHDTNLVNCCSIRRCVALPNCCAIVVKESIVCNPTNTSQLNWSFSLLNQSGYPVSYVFLAPNTPCATANPSIIALVPPLPSGSSTGLTTTVNVTGNCGTNACFLISLHNSNVVQCCSFLHCIPLSCKPNNHPPTVECPPLISQCKSNSTPITVNAFVTDVDGDPLTVTWKVDNVVVQVDNVPAGSPTAATVNLVFTFSPGLHTVNICVSDGNSPQVICTTMVEIGDKTPPQVKCPPDHVIIGFQGTIPAITNLVVASDNCTPTNQLVITQKPPPGTVVGVGTNCITVTVQDAAGNIATCQTCIIVSPISIDPNIGLNPYTAPADIPITVQTDPKLTASVAYFANGALIGTSAPPRFSFTWTKVAAGSYEIRAQATSVNGDSATSEPAFLVVNPASAGAIGAVGPLLRNPTLSDSKASFSLGTVKGEVCYIEFTESLEPANWQVLETLVGDGNLRTVQDSITNARQRFYRVRLDATTAQQRQQ